MPRNSLEGLPEAFLSNAAIKSAVSRAVAQGRIRQIATKLYTFNLDDPPEQIVRRSLWELVAACAPGALIADRTAIENRPAAGGSIFVVSERKRDIELPGLTIRSRSGAAPLDSDRPFVGGLFLSSTARAFLDNMAPSRKRGGDVSRTLTRIELEDRLDDVIRRGGPDGLNALRDEARHIAPLIDRNEEYAALDRLIGALLGTREDKLASERAKARGAGTPFDPERRAMAALGTGMVMASMTIPCGCHFAGAERGIVRLPSDPLMQAPAPSAVGLSEPANIDGASGAN